MPDHMIVENQKFLTSYSSLELLRECFKHAALEQIFDNTGNNVEPSDVDMVKSVVGLLSLGKGDYDEINQFLTNRHFMDSIGVVNLPDGEKIRNWLNVKKDIVSGIEKSCAALKENGAVDDDIPLPSDDLVDHLHRLTRLCLKEIEIGGSAPELSATQDTLFTDEHRKQIDELGYTVVEGVLSDDEVAQAREIVLRLAEWEKEQGTAHLYGNENRLQRVWNLLNKHEMFRELIQRPVIHQIMEHVFDRPTLHQKYVLHSWQANIVHEGGEAGMLHVDSAIPEPFPSWPVRCNANFLLNDFTKDNGASLLIPGTHTRPDKPTKADEADPNLIQALAPKGAVVVWNGFLWHQSGPNNTPDSRIALLAGFTASHFKEMCLEEDYTKVVDPDIQEQASPLLRRLIGTDFGIKKGALQKPPKW